MRLQPTLYLFIPALLPLLLVVNLTHADFQDGLDAYDRGDYPTALNEFLPLAEQGDVKAQFNMGILYEKGQGVPQDFQEAFRWYGLAAEQGDAHTQNVVGMLYEFGQGVPQDYTQALYWYGLAAQQGEADAQHNLGYLYHVGQGGLTQNFVQAHMWYNLAAAQGVENARELRDHVASLMTPTEFAEAQQLASEWSPLPNP